MDNTHHTPRSSAPKTKIHWGFLLVGILFVAASILTLINPWGRLEAITYGFAFLAIVEGMWLIVTRFDSALRLVCGIIDILIGVFFIFNAFAATLALPYVFAIWFIIDSVFRLATAGYAKFIGNGYYWFTILLSILGIIIGILLIFEPVVATLTLSAMVGFYLLIAGVESISYSLSSKPYGNM